jgi:hypothetical protein
MQDIHVKLNPGFPWQKQRSSRRMFFSAGKWTYISGRNITFGVQLYVVLEVGHFGKEIWNIWKVLKCGAA